MNGLKLFLKSRSAPAALAAVSASTGGLWWLSHVIENARLQGTLALLAVVGGIASLTPGLAGPDIDLDRVAAIAWLPRRALHLIAAGAVVFGAIAATRLTGDPMAQTGQTLRDVSGILGLTALAAAIAGTSLAWSPAVIWVVAMLPLTPSPGPIYEHVLTWMIQPPANTTATVTAITLCATGITTYAIVGPRHT